MPRIQIDESVKILKSKLDMSFFRELTPLEI